MPTFTLHRTPTATRPGMTFTISGVTTAEIPLSDDPDRSEVLDWLEDRLRACREHGVDADTYLARRSTQ